jgi:seryl-tRNA synthetase
MLKGKGEDASAVLAEVGGIGDELKANETALAANRRSSTPSCA